MPQSRGAQRARALLVPRADDGRLVLLLDLQIGARPVTHERRRPYKPDAMRVERGDWLRAGGAVICSVCGFEYRKHAPVVGFEWLNRLCNGMLVRL